MVSHAVSQPASLRRGGLLGIVIGAHAAIVLLAPGATTVVPQLLASPMLVELLPAAAAEEAPAAPAPPQARPAPSRERSVAAAPTPAATIATSNSTLPVASAAAPSASEARPTPAAAVPTADALSQARFDADTLNNPAPAYPPLSRRLGEEGRVVLRVSVNAQGSADSVDVKASSGSAMLDEAARRTVRSWRFIPARRGESAMQSWVLVPIIFRLEQ